MITRGTPILGSPNYRMNYYWYCITLISWMIVMIILYYECQLHDNCDMVATRSFALWQLFDTHYHNTSRSQFFAKHNDSNDIINMDLDGFDEIDFFMIRFTWTDYINTQYWINVPRLYPSLYQHHFYSYIRDLCISHGYYRVHHYQYLY